MTVWGWSTMINLYNCDENKIKNPEIIKKYVDELVVLLDMKKYGECILVDFGNNPKVKGYSMFQLIETSNISGHFANDSKSAYLDIFSCKPYDSKKAVLFSKQVFGAEEYTYQTIERH